MQHKNRMSIQIAGTPSQRSDIMMSKQPTVPGQSAAMANRSVSCSGSKPWPLTRIIWPAVLGCVLWPAVPQTAAQTQSIVNLQLYAGLTITGTVGTVYSIEYVTDPAQTNNASAWRCLEFMQLPADRYLWTDKSGAATGRRFYRAVSFAAPTNLVFIPPGTFRMGSPPDEAGRLECEGPQTAVIISRGFWMGKYEVTQEDYLAVMGENPSEFTGEAHLPVEQVTWLDATEYCAKFTRLERTAGRIAANSVYRLPTDAEWEYACRAWTSTQFSYGADAGYNRYTNQFGISIDYTNLTNYAWYQSNSGGRTHPVGQKLPNPWGLYDMHGNVWEWCSDWWSDHLPGSTIIDPVGPDSSPPEWPDLPCRVIRGGSYGIFDFVDGATSCRSAARYLRTQDGLNAYGGGAFGFRVVLAPGEP